MLSCILFHFYIKPQHIVRITLNYSSCILFHFYIKPQHWFDRKYPFVVVSYSISTSNHNCVAPYLLAFFVVSYSISTSNHNSMRAMNWMCQLYLIPFLHQTTTNPALITPTSWLYLIPFLHQTTTAWDYILPTQRLYLIPFLHQTTTSSVTLFV